MKYNVDFPIGGALHFTDVEASSPEEAIQKCYDLVDNCEEDILTTFEGEWEMYETTGEGFTTNLQYTEVNVYPS